ncbi:uncharacterized protein LY79DRAFT_593515 [Colletotrichum navitas]|uniref:Uncharacterized protein n=1 Tax=Colletotrichum navitas TaxID=681940 RepID=A0AAD8PPQ2_9PEZI|nr:uncharacterized protein LY79DRAFT_593515 [Colletotrichum navitas]KAK1574134.1 hypothetical protein LY79DRAFT_593515 [Colletotrichum navitas]
MPRLDNEGREVNFVDTLYTKGRHQNTRFLVRPPFRLGLKFSGFILSVPAHLHFCLGEIIFGGCMGSYNELIFLPAWAPLHRIPADWTSGKAAGIAAMLSVSYTALLQARIQPRADVAFGPIGRIDRNLKCIAHWGKVLIVGFAGIKVGMEHIAMNGVFLKQVLLVSYMKKGEGNGLQSPIVNNPIQPTVYEIEYNGLENAPRALERYDEPKGMGQGSRRAE